MDEMIPGLMMLALFFLFIWIPTMAVKNAAKKGTQPKKENRENRAPSARPAGEPGPLPAEAPVTAVLEDSDSPVGEDPSSHRTEAYSSLAAVPAALRAEGCGSLGTPVPLMPEPLRPTVMGSGNEAGLYQGSLGAETGEGFDPCHDEQLQSLTQETHRERMPAPEGEIPGLQLSFTGDEIVRGFVMGEILRRRA